MKIGPQGQNLIFLISQPRAGSTLLQRILGGHPQVHTVSEPWLMLHPLYALRNEGYKAEYDEQRARRAVQGFFNTLPGSDGEHVEGLRKMCSHIYGRALTNSSKCYFLDKTPRYYLVIPELCRVFPQAHYLILLRNPLAVLCSILTTWVRERWFFLHRYKHDLIRAPRLLIEGVELLGDRGAVVHYEQLVRNPESVLQGICDKIGIDFVPGMVEYGDHNLPKWSFGDQEEICKHRQPVLQNADKWRQALHEPQVWRFANDYLRLLGQETIERMGYSYNETKKILDAHQPRKMLTCLTFDLFWMLKKRRQERKKWEHAILRLARFVQQKA